MRFLNFLPLAAALVVAAPAAEPPTKDLARRNDQPFCDSKNGGDHVEGCYNPPDKPDYTKDDVLGVVVYDIKFEGTLEYYEVSFSTYNPNTQYYTLCHSGVQNTKDFQRCERIKTAFIINIDDNEIVTKETVTVYVKIVWEYSEAALPRAMKKKKGEPVNEDELKGIYYYQVGELTFQATCTKETKTSTIGDGSDHTKKEDDGLICDDPTDPDYCHAPYDDVPDNGGGGIIKSQVLVKCHFKGELTVVTIVLKKGHWDGKNDDS
ncbi:uncharacterized protein J3D65DRAFT_209180 [Phyllosticta citribraziliensis]|uniref:Uncharacterized protein n=1 Tax=Phyllosticta citribraziliensis TaxID=989973 RepID=A0ABR1M3Y9_9PEZI